MTGFNTTKWRLVIVAYFFGGHPVYGVKNESVSNTKLKESYERLCISYHGALNFFFIVFYGVLSFFNFTRLNFLAFHAFGSCKNVTRYLTDGWLVHASVAEIGKSDPMFKIDGLISPITVSMKIRYQKLNSLMAADKHKKKRKETFYINNKINNLRYTFLLTFAAITVKWHAEASQQYQSLWAPHVD